jgi:hypothetical protein
LLLLWQPFSFLNLGASIVKIDIDSLVAEWGKMDKGIFRESFNRLHEWSLIFIVKGSKVKFDFLFGFKSCHLTPSC